MGEIINLNKARKTKSRNEAKSQAATNRVSYGQTKADKALTRIEKGRADRLLDGAKREDDTA